jgi:lysine-specific permease
MSAGLVTWISICFIHIRFRKAYITQGYDEKCLPYRSPFFPYGQYLAIFMGLLVLIGEGYSTIKNSGDDYIQIIAVYVGVPFYILLYVVYKVYKKSRVVPLEECDLDTGVATFDDDWGSWEDDLSESSVENRAKSSKDKVFFKLKKVFHFFA